MASIDEKADYLKKAVATYPNFPKKGILFLDVFSVLRDPKAFECLTSLLIQYAKSISPKISCVVGLDARGFLFGPLIALELQVPFVPVRKRGKLPGVIEQVEYTLEYGKDIIEVQTESFKEGANVLVVDDLLATGGTLSAACNLLQKVGVSVACCLVIMELCSLNGRDKINAPVHSLLKYD